MCICNAHFTWSNLDPKEDPVQLRKSGPDPANYSKSDFSLTFVLKKPFNETTKFFFVNKQKNPENKAFFYFPF